MNPYSQLNQLVRDHLESLQFMGEQQNTIPEPILEPEEVAELMSESEVESVPEVVRRIRSISQLLETEQQVENARPALFEVIDVLDKIQFSLQHQQTEADYLRLNLQRTIDITIDIVNQLGLVEIQALHQPFDESTMETLASVATSEAPQANQEPWVSGQVAVVHQRGFREMNSERIVRKAKVTVIV